MKTTTFQDVLNAAAEFAMRTRDQIPGQEYVSLQGFLAAEFLELVTMRPWPEWVEPIANVQAAEQQFSKNLNTAQEMGDILGVYTADPSVAGTCRHARPVGFYELDGVVQVDTTRSNLYVEYMLPYPQDWNGATWPDLTTLTLANFLAQACPVRFRNILARKAAGHILNSDVPNSGSGQFVLAEKSLVNEINRLPPEPRWRRTIRLSLPRRGHRHGWF